VNEPLLPPPVPAASRPEELPLAEAAGRVMVRQARDFLRGKRFLAAAALVSLAPLLAVLIRNPDPVTLTRVYLLLIVAFLLPILGVSFGSGLLHGEAEEGTLTYLFTAPVSKSSIVLGKWSAALACGWGLCAASLGLAFLLSPADLGPHGGFVRSAFMAVLLGYPAYLGMFTFFGTLFRHGYIAGLIYCFGFELILWVVPGAAKRLSIGFYIRSIVEPHVPDRAALEGYFDMFPADPMAVCAAVLGGVAVLSVAAPLVRVPLKEFRTRNVQG
jgi:hypothetical protein